MSDHQQHIDTLKAAAEALSSVASSASHRIIELTSAVGRATADRDRITAKWEAAIEDTKRKLGADLNRAEGELAELSSRHSRLFDAVQS